MKSDFGRGVTYCLGLFLAHERELYHKLDSYKELSKKFPEVYKESAAVQLWFYSSADHFFELEIPETLPKKIQKRLGVLKAKCLVWRLSMYENNSPKISDAKWALDEAKALLLEIDKKMFPGIKFMKGKYQ